MIRSMTGYASRRGAAEGQGWVWEMRGVNGRGLDLRLRLPEGIEGLDPMVRGAVGRAVARGSITVSLRIARDTEAAGLTLDRGQVDRVLAALSEIESAALDRGLTLAQPTAADVLAVRGVIAQGASGEQETERLLNALHADLDVLIEDFLAMRQAEGDRLRDIIEGQLTAIEALTDQAAAAAEERRDEARAALTAALRRIVEDVTEVPEERLAQELALLAVKQDVTEEIDRLRAHVAAGRALLDEQAPAGRKLDFLAQEFNREANTLCSKAQNAALTSIGLDLKAAVDQMREQIQNEE